MARRERGSAHLFKDMATSLHIKKNTAGRSNEISLSVLDGLKSQADNRLGEADQKVRLGDLSIFTVSPKKEKKASFIDKPSSGAVGSSQQGVSRVAPESKRGTNRKAKEGASADGKSGATRPDSFASKLAKKEASAKTRKERMRERALADPDAEIKRRKRARRIRRAIVTALVSSASVAALVVGGLYLTREYQEYARSMGLLDKAFTEISRADELVIEMDGIVTQEVTEASRDEMASVGQGMEDAELHLKAATAFAEEVTADMASQESKDAAAKVVESADARRTMMQYAEVLMKADIEALEAVSVAEEAWNAVEEANGLMQEAAMLVFDTTVENTKESQAKSEQATELFEEASAKLDEASGLYPGADFSALREYIAKRIEQNGFAVQSDQAIYIQDKATAESFNEEYNRADTEAVDLASRLPKKPAQPILDAFQKNVEEERSLYFEARQRAAESDAFIREYLGEPIE